MTTNEVLNSTNKKGFIRDTSKRTKVHIIFGAQHAGQWWCSCYINVSMMKMVVGRWMRSRRGSGGVENLWWWRRWHGHGRKDGTLVALGEEPKCVNLMYEINHAGPTTKSKPNYHNPHYYYHIYCKGSHPSSYELWRLLHSILHFTPHNELIIIPCTHNNLINHHKLICVLLNYMTLLSILLRV